MMKKVEYLNDSLIIHLPCTDPAAFHAQLMSSIAANMERIVACTEGHASLQNDVTPLLKLLQTILPGERQLLRGHHQ